MGVYSRGKNWYIDFYSAGRRIRQKIGPSKKLAEKVLRKVRTTVIENKYLDVAKKSKVKFEPLSTQYLSYAKTNKRSWDRDETSMKSLRRFFGGKYIYEINPYLVEKYKAHRLTRVAPATVNREIACLKHMLNKAVEWEMAGDNPAKRVRLLNEKNERTRYLSKEEITRLLESCAGHLRPIVLTALLTGMRRNEILKLKREDIDFENAIIFVKNTKNNEVRKIPANDQLMQVLKDQEFRSPYVFTRENGKRCRSVRTGFENALQRAGIKDFRFHDLRHTFGSHLAMAGVDLITIKELMGHKTIEMTLRYAHLSPDHKRHAVNCLRFLDSHNMVTSMPNGHQVEDVSA